MPLMKDGGSIILNSSAGVKGFPALPFTVQAKQPSVLSPRTWTSGLKGKIVVNVIAPGTTDTAIFDGAPREMKDSFVSIIPIGPMGQPREIAADALFLASDDFSFVTGIELYVDSGTAQV
jgi:NAD(P)-dependent dehydrogenase (short-subunit alcohol dehydrogenase family)